MSHPEIGLRKEQLDTPALLVDLDAMERNIAKTAALLKGAGVNWRPHTKGQKVPEIAKLEIAAGAIGVTCAKLGEAEVMADNGVDHILIANQVVGPQKAARLAALCRRADVTVSVDSEANVAELDAAARAAGVRIPVVVEVNIGINRCGAEPGEPTVALAKRVQGTPGLRFVGVMGWEGHARRFTDPEQRRVACEEAVGMLTWTAQQCREAGLPVEIVSCGGTGTAEFSSRVPGVTEMQAGGIIFNDVYYSELGLDREFALTVLSTVISRPTPTRIVTDAGKKTMSSDNRPPRPIGLSDVTSVSLSAEHGKVELAEPNTDLRVGDKLEWIVGYSDTTVCLHDQIYGLRRGRVESVWPVLARGKIR